MKHTSIYSRLFQDATISGIMACVQARAKKSETYLGVQKWVVCQNILSK